MTWDPKFDDRGDQDEEAAYARYAGRKLYLYNLQESHMTDFIPSSNEINNEVQI